MTQKNPFIFILRHLTEQQFRYASSGLCLIGDLILCFFLYSYFTSEKFLLIFLDKISSSHLIDQQTMMIIQMAPSFHKELHLIIVQSLLIAFLLALVFNGLHYAFYIFKKSNWPEKYIKFMAILGVPGFIFLGLTNLEYGVISFLMILQSFSYLFVWYGFKYFQNLLNDGTQKAASSAQAQSGS